MGIFDHNFKEFRGEDPRGVLHMLQSLPLSVSATVRPLLTELVAPQKTADHLCIVETADDKWVEQVEALARWHSRELPAIHARTKTASLVPELDGLIFRVTIVLLTDKDVPAKVPVVYHEDRGHFRASLRPRYVRLWEIDPWPMLEIGRRGILPWIPLMRKSAEVVEKAARAIVRTGDRDLASRFVTMGSMRYDRNYLVGLLEELDMLLYTKEVVEATPIGQEILEAGIEKGMEKGIVQGRLEGQITLLRSYLRRRFPNLADLPELAHIRSSEQAESLLLDISATTDEPAVRELISQSLTKQN